jgi:serine/threonine protein kinase
MSNFIVMRNADVRSRNRYLILDVLGQGTFGQVVKCQNLKTQEVVAVKVVKNRTAYFNQSMMEVSVLDLVRLFGSRHVLSADPPAAEYKAR